MRESLVISLFVSAFIQALLGGYVWTSRHEPVGKWLIYLAGLCFAWTFTYGMDLASNDLATKVIWMQIRFSFNIFISLATLSFVLAHLQLSRHLTYLRLAVLLFVPILNIILVWTSASHHLFRYDFVVEQFGSLSILTWKTGPAFWLVFFYADLLFGTSLYLLAHSLLSADMLKRRQTMLILIALIIPFLADTLYNFGISPIPHFDFAPQLFTFTWILLAYAIFRYRLLDLVPMARSTLVDFIPTGVIVLDAKERIVDINPAAQQMLRVSPAVIGQAARQALAHLDQATLKQLDFEHSRQEIKVSLAFGVTGYADVEIAPLKDLTGYFNGRLVMFYDVTERRKKELRLLQFSSAIDQSPTSVVITDLDGKIEYVNPQFAQLTGYTIREATGQNPRILQSGQTAPVIYQEMWQTIKAGQTWRGEFLNKKKNGELYWELAVIAPVKDKEGKTINFIAIKEDITAQKNAEAALRQSEARLRESNLELQERIEKIVALEAALREQALRDPLTGLYNRRYLNETIDREFERARRKAQPVSILMIDIDHFKTINDTYGHLTGDECLQALAGLLGQFTRKSDIACRFGGEEFLLVLPDAPLEIAAQRADELRRMFANLSVQLPNQTIKISVSIGVAAYPAHGETSNEVINKADQALYEAKRLGRDRVVVWRGAV